MSPLPNLWTTEAGIHAGHIIAGSTACAGDMLSAMITPESQRNDWVISMCGICMSAEIGPCRWGLGPGRIAKGGGQPSRQVDTTQDE